MSTACLDGLRGLAAIVVFTQHALQSQEIYHGFGENGHHYFGSFPFLRVFFTGGGAAVAVFLVLSGFLLAQAPLKLIREGREAECRQNLLSAAVKRPFRLYIPCLAVGLIIALLKHAPIMTYPSLMWSPTLPTLRAELHHWLQHSVTYFNPFQRHAWEVGSYEYIIIVWTIPMELKGSYLVYAYCCLLSFAPLTSAGQAVLSTVLSIAFLQLGWWTAGSFIAGVGLASVFIDDLDEQHVLSRLPKVTHLPLLSTIFAAGWYLLGQPSLDGKPEWAFATPGWHFLASLIPGGYTANSYYRFWGAYGAVLVIYAILRIKQLRSFFGSKPLRYLGSISFILYLIHLPLLFSIRDTFLQRMLGNVPFTDDLKFYDNILYIPDIGPTALNLRFVVQWFLMLVITLPLSHLGMICIDRPSLRFSKFIGGCVVDKSRPSYDPLLGSEYSEEDMQEAPVRERNASLTLSPHQKFSEYSSFATVVHSPRLPKSFSKEQDSQA